MKDTINEIAQKALTPEFQVLGVEVGALIDQYRTGTNNIMYHILFLSFMVGRVTWFFWSKWMKKKKIETEQESADLDLKIKQAELIRVERYNKPDTAQEELDKLKRLREQLFKNIKKNDND